jgi:MFS family permease
MARFLRRQPMLLGAISLDMFAVLLGGATALLPIIADQLLQTGPVGLGLLRAAPAVGALAMSFWLASHPLHAAGRALFIGVALFGLATLALGLSRSLPLSLAILLLLGAADMVSVVIRQTLVQLHTPDEMRGRVSSVNAIFIGASNQLGEFESGLTAQWFGLVPSILLGGPAGCAASRRSSRAPRGGCVSRSAVGWSFGLADHREELASGARRGLLRGHQVPHHVVGLGHAIHFLDGAQLVELLVRARGRVAQRADALGDLVERRSTVRCTAP